MYTLYDFNREFVHIMFFIQYILGRFSQLNWDKNVQKNKIVKT